MKLDFLSTSEREVIYDYFVNDISLREIVKRKKLNITHETLRKKIELILYKIFFVHENFLNLLEVLKLITNNKIFIFFTEKDPKMSDINLKYKLCLFFIKKINTNIVSKYYRKNKFFISYLIEYEPIIKKIFDKKKNMKYEEFKSLFQDFTNINEDVIYKLYHIIHKKASYS